MNLFEKFLLQSEFFVSKSDLLADTKTIDREFGTLEKINDNYPKIVLSLDKFLDNNRNRIEWFNLIDFLKLTEI